MTGNAECPKCQRSIDDHGAGGACQTAAKDIGPRHRSSEASGGPPAPAAGRPITLLLQQALNLGRSPTGFVQVEVDMPAATTVRYAAKRCAERVGLDPQAEEWVLVEPGRHEAIDGALIIAPWDGLPVFLGWRA